MAVHEIDAWFEKLTGNAPYPWQRSLAEETELRSRLIRIPTGFGKTAGVFAAWLYNRVVRADSTWPRRLVICLPMRVLVEQTEAAVRGWLESAGLLGQVGLQLLMGGVDASDWHLFPDRPTVLIGTMDMLLSRALNRGYAAARARWPIEFGLLHQDCLWVFDEVQLMDAGIATSAQLEAFRRGDQVAGRSLRPAATWWMSATLQPDWLSTVDARDHVASLPVTQIPPAARVGRLWDDVQKPVTKISLKWDPRAVGDRVRSLVGESTPGGLKLVVVNTVDRALALHDELVKHPPDGFNAESIKLVHSRFRPHERRRWRDQFLRRDAPTEGGRIIVATQVIEAGVDLDANLLVTELAPWSSLVQRFGRLARGGGKGAAVVLDLELEDDKKAAPYCVADLQAAASAIARLTDVSPRSLEEFEENLSPAERSVLFPYEADHLLLRNELDELFDTTADLSGADLDISRFIRSGDERDVTVFWIDVPSRSPDLSKIKAAREALCPVPFLKARDWLFGKGTRLKERKRAWVWDYLDGEWRVARLNDIVPGRTLLVASDSGGYDLERGFSIDSGRPVAPVIAPELDPILAEEHRADDEEAIDALSVSRWKTVATHGTEVAAIVSEIGREAPLDPKLVALLELAGLWHDLGKAHRAFQVSIVGAERPARSDLAKAPNEAWRRPGQMYKDEVTGEHRRGFRHELASALALFAVLRRHAPTHAALLGPWREFFDAVKPSATEEPTPVERRILALDAASFDLVAYLVASHHGKVRLGLHASPADQKYAGTDPDRQPLRGVIEGDELPSVVLDPSSARLPALVLTLAPATIGLSPMTGASWTDRTNKLVERHGIWALAFLEACLRAADVRASQLLTADPLLQEVAR